MGSSPVTETDLKRAIVALLRKLGYSVHVTSERRRGYSKMPKGLPDLFVRHVGKQFSAWVEIKLPGQKLRPEQQDFRDAALRAGERHYIVQSVEDLQVWSGGAGHGEAW